MLDVELENKIIISTRIKLLQRTIHEIIDGAYKNFSDKFRRYDKMVSTIELGLEKKIIKMVEFCGIKGNTIINLLTFTIDWEKHTLACSNQKDVYEFDSGLSLSEQVSRALPSIVEIVHESMIDAGVDSIETIYTFRNDIDTDSARKILGTSQLSQEKIKKLSEFQNAAFEANMTPNKLAELTVSFKTKKLPPRLRRTRPGMQRSFSRKKS